MVDVAFSGFANAATPQSDIIALRHGSMLDETGFYAPSMAHNALPGRPWPGISVFLGHNSTVSKQLRYSPARECVCAAGCPALTPLTL